MAVKLSKFEQAVLDNRLRLIKAEPAIDAFVQREMRKLVAEWNQELRNLVGSTSRLSATDVASLERKLVTLRGKLEASTKKKLKQIEQQLGKTTRATFTSEVFKHTQMIDTHLAKFVGREGVSFNGLNRKAINAAYRQSFPPGMMRAAFGKLPPVMAKRLRRDIAEAIADGWKVDQLARHWRNMHGAAGATANGTKAVAHTMVMQASSNAQLHAYTAQDTIIKGVQWEATFDSRTCPMCAGRHARKYPKEEAPAQPAHLNCRCTWLPVFLDESLNTKFDTRTAYKKPDNSTVVFKKQSREFDQFLKRSSKVTQREFFGSAFKMRAWRAGQLDLDQLTDVHGNWITDRVARKMVDQTWLKNIGKLRTLDDIAGPPATPRLRTPAGTVTPGTPPVPKEPPPKPKPKPPVTLPPGQESTLGKLPKKPKAPPVEKPPAPPVQPPSKGMPPRGKDWQPNKDAHLGAHDVDLEGIPKKFHESIHRGAKRVTEAFPSIRVKTLGGSKSFDRVWGNPDSPFRTRSGRKKTRRMPKGAAAVYSRPASGGFGPDFKPGFNDHVHIKSSHLTQISKPGYADNLRRINQQHIDKATRYEAAAKSYDEAASLSAGERAARTAKFDEAIEEIRDKIKAAATPEEATRLRVKIGVLKNEREGFANYSQANHDRWRKYADEAKARKRWTVSDNLIREDQILESIEATIAHEYGHVVMFQAKNGQYFRDAWKNALNKHGVTRKDRIAMSEYAATNDDELFAEAFSAWAMGRREWIPDSVFRALDESMEIWNRVAQAASYQ